MIYLYAIIDRPDVALPDILGLEDVGVQVLRCRDIGAVVSLSARADMMPTEDNVWRHEEVMESLMADRTILPVRFGTVLADESAVQDALTSHYDEFTSDLKWVRGHVELGLRVVWENDEDYSRLLSSEPESSPARELQLVGAGPQAAVSSGRAYMSARLQEEQRTESRREKAEALAEDIHLPLARLSTRDTRRMLVTARLLLTGAYLVERERIDDFLREVEFLASEHPELRLLCTGPWPPFSFVTVSDKR